MQWAQAWQWRSEIALVRTALFLIGAPQSLEPSFEQHHFFFDRYLRLSHYHGQRGRAARAERLFAKAHMHWIAFDPDEPPPAVAAVMPIPRPPIFTWAVSDDRDREPTRKVA
jgi:hypothetical protein